MSKNVDGILIDTPPVNSQIIDLAQLHRKQLNDAIYHNEIRLGDFCLSQRKRVYDFAHELEPSQKADFYNIYNSELERLAVHDGPHNQHEETNQSHIFMAFAVLVAIVVVLYFAVLRTTIS
jgi:hypothetical protein